jgi:hypothetical protein
MVMMYLVKIDGDSSSCARSTFCHHRGRAHGISIQGTVRAYEILAALAVIGKDDSSRRFCFAEVVRGSNSQRGRLAVDAEIGIGIAAVFPK